MMPLFITIMTILPVLWCCGECGYLMFVQWRNPSSDQSDAAERLEKAAERLEKTITIFWCEFSSPSMI